MRVLLDANIFISYLVGDSRYIRSKFSKNMADFSVSAIMLHPLKSSSGENNHVQCHY